MAVVVKKDLAEEIFSVLENEYPNVNCALDYSNPFELLVATILSAQCTDKRVNIVTKKLFKKYKSIDDYADADFREFQKCIKSTGFYQNKAKHIVESAGVIRSDYRSKVPNTMVDLIFLPGVGRKTANIVLLNAFGIVEGIAVDTHVKRLSSRLEFSSNSNPDKIEKDLMELFSKDKWSLVSDLLIVHGRTVCDARKPLCAECVLNKLCPSAFNFN